MWIKFLLLAMLVESGNLLSFLHRWILTDGHCTLISEGSVGALLLNFWILLFTNMLSFDFKIQNTTNGRFCSFVSPVRSRMWSTEKDSDVHCIYCNFLDLITFHSGSLEDIVCFSLLLLFLHAVPIFRLMAFWTFFQFNTEDRIQWLTMLLTVIPSYYTVSLKPIAYIV